MAELTNSEILKNGIWTNNPALMQLLGLCPLLAVSNNTINAVTLGIATTIVLVISNTIIAALKNYIDTQLRIPYFMFVIASMVTLLLIIMQAASYELYKNLGVYLALITTNCVILARVEAFAYKTNIKQAFFDGLANGLGFFIVLFLLGSLREIIGQGTLFANFNLLFGSTANNWIINLPISNNYHFILALLPPGAFITLGLLIALKNYFTTSNAPQSPRPIAYELPATLSSIRKIPKKQS